MWPSGRRTWWSTAGAVRRPARGRRFDAILDSLKNLEDDETLLVQSGKPVVIFKTHPDAPRVLIANSNLVPHWATWEYFDELARKGLIMYGQMTAGSWIYIGTQGILQGTYETFGALRRAAGLGIPEGQIRPDRRPGGHGRRPADGHHHERRRGTDRRGRSAVAPSGAARMGYVDTVVDTLEEAMTLVEENKAAGKPLSSGSSATPPMSIRSWSCAR